MINREIVTGWKKQYAYRALLKHSLNFNKILDEEFFPKRPSGASLHILSNSMIFSLVCNPSPLFSKCLALIMVTEVWLLLDIG